MKKSMTGEEHKSNLIGKTERCRVWFMNILRCENNLVDNYEIMLTDSQIPINLLNQSLDSLIREDQEETEEKILRYY